MLIFLYRRILLGISNFFFRLFYSKGTNQSIVMPVATYSPWLVDEKFREIYKKVKKHTLVDEYRAFELWKLVQESAKLEGALIEVGVWRGGTGAIIAESARLNGIESKIYLCDTFTGVVKAGEKDSSYKGGEHKDTSRQIVEDLIKSLSLESFEVLEGIFPDETAHQVTEDKLRFCHIDVDVYESAKAIVEWVWNRLVVGGIVVFDDYGFQSCDGITILVNELREKKDRVIIHNLNGHAIMVKTTHSG